MQIITGEDFYQEINNQTKKEQNEATLDKTVLDIIQTVREKKDQALLEYTEAFDGAVLDSLIVTEEEINQAKACIEKDVQTALRKAIDRIRAFHEAQKEKSWLLSQDKGVMLGQIVTPIEKVGVYIPGGKAGYPSTVLMAVIPAQIAGATEIVITTPPGKDGKVNPYVLAAADLLGITKIYKTGGAQAIAALAYGTETIKKVDKIVGPGNAYVARAKKWVFGDVGIDMIAGPSEICVIADEQADASFIAADLLSQAEHDESARAICITTSGDLAKEIQTQIISQTERLERKTIIEASIKEYGSIVVAQDLNEAIEIANLFAPEHLELIVENPMDMLPLIKNAGAIFLGSYAPEPLGDYFAGPNHTLPTSGTARFASPLGVYDFIKRSSLIRYPKAAFDDAAEQIITLANIEGLTAHANSIQIRKEKKNA